jgi:serine/threonine protein kinase
MNRWHLLCRFVLIVQLLSALVHIHKRGFVHARLTPSSILVLRSTFSRFFCIKVAGLGSALPTTFPHATAWGTLQYCAPEQFMAPLTGSRCPAAVNLDTWAVGVILAETLLGCSLQTVIQTAAVLKAVHERRNFFQPVLRMLELVPGLNPSWVAVVQAMLKYDTRPSPEAVLSVLMLDPAFAPHRQEMLSGLLSPPGEAIRVRAYAFSPAY